MASELELDDAVERVKTRLGPLFEVKRTEDEIRVDLNYSAVLTSARGTVLVLEVDGLCEQIEEVFRSAIDYDRKVQGQIDANGKWTDNG